MASATTATTTPTTPNSAAAASPRPTTGAGPEGAILKRWQQFARYPGGKWLFSRSIGWMARYSSTIRASVVELSPGRSVVTMRERAAVRNHLRSVHATALVTFGEMASGLAMLAGMPPSARAIVTRIETEYVKKARGLLTATGEAPIPSSEVRAEHIVRATIRDQAGDVVATVAVTWLVGPTESRGT